MNARLHAGTRRPRGHCSVNIRVSPTGKKKKKRPHTDNLVIAAGMNSDCTDTWPKCSIQQHELLHGGGGAEIDNNPHSRPLVRREQPQHQILGLMDVQVIIKNQKWRLGCGSMERFCSSDTWMDDPPASDLILGRTQPSVKCYASDWHSRQRCLVCKRGSRRGFTLSLPRRCQRRTPWAVVSSPPVFVTSARDVCPLHTAKRHRE